MIRVFLVLAAFAWSAFAADVSGNWKVTAEGPNGTIERTFLFKVEGDKLTGESNSSMLGKSTITDGKVDGDTLTFSMAVNFQGEEQKVSYKGKVSGDEIKLTSEFGSSGFSIEWTGKREPR
ncbi:MAG: hypothetical protein KIT83_10015 [Bryobacterales bacterium]|nr:hypothetical protein [Bryobacterales bacterium]